MIVLQTHLFARQKKKLRQHQISDLDKAIQSIMANPKIGDQKKGDLALVRVYKFKIKNQRYLLAYQLVDSKKIVLLTLGAHENFYRDLKRAIR